MAAGFNWFLVLSCVFLCNLVKTLLPSISSFLSKIFHKDADQETEMRTEIQNMRMELSSINMMDEFARYARLVAIPYPVVGPVSRCLNPWPVF